MTALALKPRRVLRAPGLLAILAAILVGFALGARDFTTAANLTNIALQSSVLLLLALPMTFVVMTEGLDLSIGAVLSLASVVLAQVVVATGSVSLAVAAGLTVGAALGAVNGILIAFVRIPPFVATLGMLGIAQGLALIVSDGQSITGIPASVDFVYEGRVLGAPCRFC